MDKAMSPTISVFALSLVPLGLQAYRSIPEHGGVGMCACLHTHHHMNLDHAPRVFV